MHAAVLLDLYDTVATGDWSAWRDTFASLAGLTPQEVSAAYWETRPTRNTGGYPDARSDVSATLLAAGVEPADDLVAQIVEAEEAFGSGGVRLFDDSLEVVAELRSRGVRTALVSNCSRGTRPIVDALGLPDAFDAVILSVEVGSLKPEPAIYQAALAALGADARECLFVDDQTPFCDGARALGIDTRLIMRPGVTPFEGYAPTTNGHTVVTSLRELL